MIDLPIPLTPNSELGRLLAALEAAEAAVAAQRLVCTKARDAYSTAELAQRRGAYALSKSYRQAEGLDAEHARVQELRSTRDLEEQRFAPMVAQWRELRDRFELAYAEFCRLHDSMIELKRLGG